MDIDTRKILSILVLLLIPVYIVMVYSLPSTLSSSCQPDVNAQRGLNDNVGVCTETSATVLRQYYFGTIRMPVRVVGINFDVFHRTFIPLIAFISFAIYREYI